MMALTRDDQLYPNSAKGFNFVVISRLCLSNVSRWCINVSMSRRFSRLCLLTCYQPTQTICSSYQLRSKRLSYSLAVCVFCLKGDFVCFVGVIQRQYNV
ncbi:hypothetical protein Hanom_Chr06g00562421 [Helianthus anomalus]